MATYAIINFLVPGDVFTVNNYPIEEYREYLTHFQFIQFSFDGVIKSLQFDLAPNSSSSVCNANAYNQSYDEIVSSGNERFPRPVAFLTLTLWRTGNPEITVQKNY